MLLVAECLLKVIVIFIAWATVSLSHGMDRHFARLLPLQRRAALFSAVVEGTEEGRENGMKGQCLSGTCALASAQEPSSREK